MNSYQKIILLSKHYYNEGLERAQVHNLSGAIESLETSLRYYKGNIDARNLLGLVYYETGEWVKALREWVISVNLKPEENLAKEYVDNLRPEMTRSGRVNQSIKKYNQSLAYAQNGSDDLAIIQLKKIISVSPNFLRAHQLLALVYIHNKQYIQAKDVLRKAGRIDANNTLTLKYLKEVNNQLRDEKEKKSPKKKHVSDDSVSYLSGNETIIRPTYFRDNSTIASIGNIVFGLIMGFLISFFLVVPGMERDLTADNKQKLIEANNTISSQANTIKQQKEENDAIKTQLQQALTNSSNSQSSASFYKNFLTAYVAFNNEEYIVAGDVINSVKEEEVEADFKDVFVTMKEQINEKYIESLYEASCTSYNQRSYEDAITGYEKILALDEKYEDGYVLYYLAHSYRSIGDNQKATIYFNKIIEYYPDSEKAESARKYLESMED